ncbi:unnamed protein product [Callosobruchus maculatus]|uniref:Uncharacterized protein n=1 Tax=Callosobruchus maculatus TaxID=64391 RepID=A0A653CNT2_CALMS|nr:unnamed protein product [Callosobruchus maculatus]
MYTEYAYRPSPSTAFAISASLNLITIRLYIHFSVQQQLQNYVFSSIVAHRDYIIYYFIMESCQAGMCLCIPYT